MCKFNRGIRGDFVEALNDEYDSDGWWKKLMDDKSLFLGIRDEYLDVYLNGGRVLSLKHVKGEFVGETHFKYLVDLARADTKSEYVRFRNGTFAQVKLNEPYRYISESLQGIKKSLKPFQGEEKEGVHSIIMHNKNVVDTEIQFPYEARRIDYAALYEINGNIRIVFFEAKNYSNAQIRHPEKQPEVLSQIEAYDRIIEKHREEIEDAYLQVAKNISCLQGWSSRRSDIFSKVATRGLSVDPEVRLVMFNFKNPQKKEANRPGGNFTRLREALGSYRVLTKGDPKRFEMRMKFPE